MEHTINCLRFGSRAVQIKQHAQINEVAEDKAMIFQHESKIKELRARLSHLEDGEEEEDDGITGERKVKGKQQKVCSTLSARVLMLLFAYIVRWCVCICRPKRTLSSSS